MAWCRIHDGAMTHPKVGGMSDKAFRLWVWGLAHSQQHLTDGLITLDAVPARLKRASQELIARRLWEPHDVGFKVHDYLDWNDSREAVMAKRDGAKNRFNRWAGKRVSQRVANTTSQTLPAHSGVGSSALSEERIDAAELQDPVARFIRETYPRLYAKCRHGAFFGVNEARDFDVCEELVTTYGDRLVTMLEYFLSLPPGKDVLNQPGTPRQFKHMAPLCDAELRRHGK